VFLFKKVEIFITCTKYALKITIVEIFVIVLFGLIQILNENDSGMRSMRHDSGDVHC